LTSTAAVSPVKFNDVAIVQKRRGNERQKLAQSPVPPGRREVLPERKVSERPMFLAGKQRSRPRGLG
jgi:hypothetical protein